MTVSQDHFTRALLDPDMPAPGGLSDPDGRPAGRRFSVYRNNVAVSLTEALQAAFPVVHRLVGEEFFKAMAGVFLRQYPPRSPLMMFYGADMPAFLADFPPVAHLGYLPDVARMELALRRAYHAADARAIDPAALQTLAPDALVQASLTLAPSCILLQSNWPLYDLWLANTRPDAPPVRAQAQDILITRAQYDPEPVALGPGAAAFVTAVQKRATIGEALVAAGPDFDLAGLLGILFAGNAIIDIESE